MKLFFFECGILRSQKGFFVSGEGSKSFVVPVPYFLIEHENGYVLFDTGHNFETSVDAKKFLGDGLVDAYGPEMQASNHVLANLKLANIDPSEIKYVICSHLHFDHAGGIGLFPNATYIVQRAELHYAYVPDPFMKAAYKREDFDKEVDWLILDGWQDNKYDIFGDGKLTLHFTPGHTPGHMALLLKMDHDNDMMLVADACYTVENLDNLALSGLSYDNGAYLKNLYLFRELQKQGVQIVTGHDPVAWPSYRKYPEFYS